MRCQRQILNVCWLVHVSNAEVLQRSGLSTIGDILRHRRLSLFGHVARLDPRCSASDGGYLRRQKSNGQLEKTTGSPSQRPAQQDSGGCHNARLLSMLWRSEIARGHDAAQRSLGLRDDDDGDDDDDGCKTCVKNGG